MSCLDVTCENSVQREWGSPPHIPPAHRSSIVLQQYKFRVVTMLFSSCLQHTNIENESYERTSSGNDGSKGGNNNELRRKSKRQFPACLGWDAQISSSDSQNTLLEWRSPSASLQLIELSDSISAADYTEMWISLPKYLERYDRISDIHMTSMSLENRKRNHQKRFRRSLGYRMGRSIWGTFACGIKRRLVVAPRKGC
ncbi:hypothetical protein L211DRAFT_849515 [Terfezia boudieri ATCC MYA-4762]|uniref:Uncharacterized protein n=1 Tax=Terfezia boudieri ATCC MYA-4762 TaxID=1051890 RepID=A0A3N4LLX5_9PEZI|nr:hypothetical protein L211DRAFT_849515 [Terfezia boudieri ATCC MYA-4762]